MDAKLTAASGLGGREILVLARNTQGLEVRANVLKLKRYTIVFEVYDHYSILQISEVLAEFKILMDGLLIYNGRAVITKIVNTGVLWVCEASLDESWLDVDHFSSGLTPGKFREELSLLLTEVDKIETIRGQFKVAISDLQYTLLELRTFMDKAEVRIKSAPGSSQQQMERLHLAEGEDLITPRLSRWFTWFDEVSNELPEEALPAHRNYVRQLLHPIILYSPFVYRTYHKPLGYAGDYEMVNMILRDPYEGPSLFSKALNVCFLKNPPAEAHRNRIKYLTAKLGDETRRVLAERRNLRVFNLGCGPSKEVQNFLINNELSDRTDFTLLDFNDETLEYARRILTDLKKAHRRDTSFQFFKKSVHQLLKEHGRPGAPEMRSGQYDVVYCAGLFDYMSDRICKRLMNIFYDLLAPGGLLVATNVDSSKPFRHSMEFLLEWHLICRNQAQFQALNPDKAPPGSFQVRSEETGVNVFIEVRKPHDAV